MTEACDNVAATAESRKDASVSKPRRGLFSRFRRRKTVVASNPPIEEMNQREKDEETVQTISESERTDCKLIIFPTKEECNEVVSTKEEEKVVVPTKQEDEDLVVIETETRASDDSENDSIASSSPSLVSSCSASSFL